MSKACRKCGVDMQRRATGGWRCKPCDNAYQRLQYEKNADVMRKRKRDHMARARRNPETRDKYIGHQRKAWHNGGYQKRRDWVESLKHSDPWRWKALIVHVGKTGNELKSLFDDQCGLCGLTGRALEFETMQLDHIIPKSRGGTNEIENLRWVCKQANMAKRDLLDDEFLTICRDVAEWIGRRILDSTT